MISIASYPRFATGVLGPGQTSFTVPVGLFDESPTPGFTLVAIVAYKGTTVGGEGWSVESPGWTGDQTWHQVGSAVGALALLTTRYNGEPEYTFTLNVNGVEPSAGWTLEAIHIWEVMGETLGIETDLWIPSETGSFLEVNFPNLSIDTGQIRGVYQPSRAGLGISYDLGTSVLDPFVISFLEQNTDDYRANANSADDYLLAIQIGIPFYTYQDRVRLVISKQASNIGRSGAIQFADYALSLTVTPQVRFEVGSPQVIGHALDPYTPALQYYVKSLSEEEGLLTYTGETLLARLSREQPEDFTAMGPFTGREALEYILTQWAAKRPWLAWDPLPEFYLSGDTALPRFPGLLLINEDASKRKTMREWLEQYFRVFEGYTFQATAAGKLRVVPPPWADPTPRVALTLNDFIQVAEARDSDSIRNVATVTSQGLAFGDSDIVVTNEFYTYPGTGPGGAIVMNHDVTPGTTITVTDVSGAIVYRAGVDYLFYNPGSSGHSEIQRLPTGGIGPSATIAVSYRYPAPLEEVMVPSGFALWGRIQNLNNFVPWGPKPTDLTLDYKPLGPITAAGGYAQPPILDMNNTGALVTYAPTKWPLHDNTLLIGNEIRVTWNVRDWLSQWQTGDIGPYNNPGQGVLPLDNKEHLLGITNFTAPGTDNFSPQQAKLWLWGQWAGDGVFLRAQVWLADQKIAAPFATGLWVHGIWVQLNGRGRKLGRSSRTYIGRYAESDTDIPGVTENRATFGIREETFDTGLLSIPDDVLLARIARSKVLERMNPAQIVVAQIAPPFRVGMEDIGREFILPGGRRGLLESLDYTETHEAGSSAVSLVGRFRITENPLANQGNSSWTGVSTYGEGYYTEGL